MPMFVGLILGVVLTVATAFMYDTSTGRAPNGLPPSAANGRPPLVNWDVVNDDWQDVRVVLQNAGTNIERGWKRLTG
jgi:hypothetical protein